MKISTVKGYSFSTSAKRDVVHDFDEQLSYIALEFLRRTHIVPYQIPDEDLDREGLPPHRYSLPSSAGPLGFDQGGAVL